MIYQSAAVLCPLFLCMDLPTRFRYWLARMSRSSPHFPLKTRVVRGIDRALRQLRPVPLHTSVDGARFLVDTEDIVQFMVCYFGGFDSHVRRALANAAGSEPIVIWDVGANIGAVSLPLCASLPQARVYAFEPSPASRALLQRNASLNEACQSRYTILPFALGDRDATAPFFESNELFNQGVGSFARTRSSAAVPVTVDVHRGDDLIARGLVPAPDLIKIDVEGFEYEVLAGLSGVLGSGRPATIIYENTPYRVQQSGHSATDIRAQLVEAGFTLSKIGPDGATVPLTVPMLDHQVDCLARRARIDA